MPCVLAARDWELCPCPAPLKENPLFLVITLFITVIALVVASMQPYNLLGDPWRLRFQRRFRR